MNFRDKFNLLIVEDELIVARDIEARLCDAGHQVVGVATNAADALRIVAESEPDLALLDINIQGDKDGVELAEILGSQFGIPFIFLTAYSSPEILGRAKSVGPIGYLLKPFSDRELQVVVEMAMHRWQSEQESRLNDAAMRSISSGVIVCDRQKRILSTNRAFCEITGFSENEVLGRTCKFMQGPMTSSATIAAIAEALALGREFSGEILNSRKDGTVFWNDLRISPVRDRLGRVSHYVGITRDVTENRRMAAQLIENEEKIRSVFSGSLDALVVMNSEGRISDWNKSAEVIFGWNRAEAVGRPLIELVFSATELEGPFDSGDSFPAEKLARIANKRIETVARKSSGIDFPVEMVFVPIQHGGSESYAGFFRDLSERNAAAEKERSLQLELEQSRKMETFGTLAGGFAHEFNNILQGAMSYQDIALITLPSGGVERSYIDGSKSELLRARDLVKRILLLARRGSDLSMKPVVLGRELAEILPMVRAALPSSASVDLNTSDWSGQILGDVDLLQLLLSNLCENSAESFSSAGGKIEIRLIPPQRLTPPREGAVEELFVGIAVADDGSGIDAATAQRIFDPFFSTKGPRGHAGLGLPIVQGIATSHGGFCRLNSSLGRGTVVEVYFPVLQSALEERNPIVSPASPAPVAKRKRILLADDEDCVRSVVKLVLEEKGFLVDAAVDGLFAKENFDAQSAEYFLAIVDLSMPRMDGAALVEHINSVRSDMKFVIMSGNHDNRSLKIPSSIRSVVNIAKPFSVLELELAISKLEYGSSPVG